MKTRSSSFFSGLFCMSMACGAVEVQQLNSGKLLLEDIPPIPEQVKQGGGGYHGHQQLRDLSGKYEGLPTRSPRVEYGDERDPAMRAHLEKISPLNNVEKIGIPLLVVQGQNDPRVPVTEAEQIVKALRTKGQPVWYMNALNEGHGYRKKENRDVYQQVVVMFFRKYLLEEQEDRRHSASSVR